MSMSEVRIEEYYGDYIHSTHTIRVSSSGSLSSVQEIVSSVVKESKHHPRTIALVDDATQVFSTGVVVSEFWYTVLTRGALSYHYQKPRTVDGLGFLPALLLKYNKESLNDSDQLAFNMTRIHTYYTALQSYYMLKIDSSQTYTFLAKRQKLLRSNDANSVMALMQLLCYWSNCQSEAEMKQQWNATFHQWRIANYTGTNEAVVKFATLVMQEPFGSVKRIFQANNIATLTNNLVQCTLDRRQAIVNAFIDVFRSHTHSLIHKHTSYTEIKTEDKLFLADDVEFNDEFKEKMLLIYKNKVRAPCLDSNGTIIYNTTLTP
jgi:hypothetical protein